MASPTLHTAHALWQARRLDEAAAVCRFLLDASPRDAEAFHLLGLIRKDAGALAESEQLLLTSIALAPTRVEFLANLGNLLLQQNRTAQAAAVYGSALSLDPLYRPARFGLARAHSAAGAHAAAQTELRTLVAADAEDSQAWSALADSLREDGRYGDAENAFRRALAVAPNRAISRHNLGSLLSQLGRAEEALDELDRAASLGLRGRELDLNRARTLLQLYRIDDAEEIYTCAVRNMPRDVDAHRELAQLRFMRGDPDFARDAITACAQYRRDAPLQMLLADILRRAGDLPRAEIVLRKLLAANDALPEARTALATVLHEMRRLPEAQIEALAATQARPDNEAFAENLVAIRLAMGHAAEAAQLIETWRARQPLDQRWIAYRATLAKLRGEPLYRELHDYMRLVRVFDLQPPADLSTADFNSALSAALIERQVFARHPLNQSLRNGSQTARSLLQESNPLIRAAVGAFSEPIAAYLASLGNDGSHPLTARNRGRATLSGCWSVQLQRAGYHSNHIHPQGWISSAYYVSVPRECTDATTRSGWLKFGETSLGIPGDGPDYVVQPQVGRLVLFPSYMWHGTIALQANSRRVTMAFDAVPAAPPALAIAVSRDALTS